MIGDMVRIAKRTRRVKKNGFRSYGKDAQKICRAIVEDCWNGDYFQTSTGHFADFYMRDFAWCVPSLVQLGYKEQVHKTLQWALDHYKRAGEVTTTITPRGKTVNYFAPAPDSLACLLFALRATGARSLVKDYQGFLLRQVGQFRKDFLTGKDTVKHGYFSSMKDHALRERSCYNQCMVALLARECALLEIPCSIRKQTAWIKEKYWTGRRFIESPDYQWVSGDSNVIPFFFNLFPKEMAAKAVKAMQEQGLDKPFPLRYTAHQPGYFRKTLTVFAPNYEGTTIWAHLGMLYLHVLHSIGHVDTPQVLRQYKQRIEKYGTFLEVYHPSGEPYETWSYVSDEGMLWASMWLAMNTK